MASVFFRVDGADLETGEETYLVVQAADSEDAERIARKQGLLTASVRIASALDWGATPAPEPQAATITAASQTLTFDSITPGADPIIEPAPAPAIDGINHDEPIAELPAYPTLNDDETPSAELGESAALSDKQAVSADVSHHQPAAAEATLPVDLSDRFLSSAITVAVETPAALTTTSDTTFPESASAELVVQPEITIPETASSIAVMASSPHPYDDGETYSLAGDVKPEAPAGQNSTETWVAPSISNAPEIPLSPEVHSLADDAIAPATPVVPEAQASAHTSATHANYVAPEISNAPAVTFASESAPDELSAAPTPHTPPEVVSPTLPAPAARPSPAPLRAGSLATMTPVNFVPVARPGAAGQMPPAPPVSRAPAVAPSTPISPPPIPKPVTSALPKLPPSPQVVFTRSILVAAPQRPGAATPSGTAPAAPARPATPPPMISLAPMTPARPVRDRQNIAPSAPASSTAPIAESKAVSPSPIPVASSAPAPQATPPVVPPMPPTAAMPAPLFSEAWVETSEDEPDVSYMTVSHARDVTGAPTPLRVEPIAQPISHDLPAAEQSAPASDRPAEADLPTPIVSAPDTVMEEIDVAQTPSGASEAFNTAAEPTETLREVNVEPIDVVPDANIVITSETAEPDANPIPLLTAAQEGPAALELEFLPIITDEEATALEANPSAVDSSAATASAESVSAAPSEGLTTSAASMETIEPIVLEDDGSRASADRELAQIVTDMLAMPPVDLGTDSVALATTEPGKAIESVTSTSAPTMPIAMAGEMPMASVAADVDAGALMASESPQTVESATSVTAPRAVDDVMPPSALDDQAAPPVVPSISHEPAMDGNAVEQAASIATDEIPATVPGESEALRIITNDDGTLVAAGEVESASKEQPDHMAAETNVQPVGLGAGQDMPTDIAITSPDLAELERANISFEAEASELLGQGRTAAVDETPSISATSVNLTTPVESAVIEMIVSPPTPADPVIAPAAPSHDIAITTWPSVTGEAESLAKAFDAADKESTISAGVVSTVPVAPRSLNSPSAPPSPATVSRSVSAPATNKGAAISSADIGASRRGAGVLPGRTTPAAKPVAKAPGGTPLVSGQSLRNTPPPPPVGLGRPGGVRAGGLPVSRRLAKPPVSVPPRRPPIIPSGLTPSAGDAGASATPAPQTAAALQAPTEMSSQASGADDSLTEIAMKNAAATTALSAKPDELPAVSPASAEAADLSRPEAESATQTANAGPAVSSQSASSVDSATIPALRELASNEDPAAIAVTSILAMEAPAEAAVPAAENSHALTGNAAAIPSNADEIEPHAVGGDLVAGSGMEQVVTKLAWDQAAQPIEHSTGSALNRLATIEEPAVLSAVAAERMALIADHTDQSAPVDLHHTTEADIPVAIPVAHVAPRTRASGAAQSAPPAMSPVISLVLGPLAFLMTLAGVGVMAWSLLRSGPGADSTDNERILFHLQSLNQTVMGGMLMFAGLLVFVGIVLAYLLSAVRAARHAE